MRTFQIEIRVDFQDESKYDHITAAARDAARGLLATAMLLKDKREPQASLQTGDLFEGNKELELIEAGGE